MVYEYKCSNKECGCITERDFSMKDSIPPSVVCGCCGSPAYRIYSNIALQIPESMKATSTIYNNNTGSDFDYIKHRMAKGVRPSGKEKVYY